MREEEVAVKKLGYVFECTIASVRMIAIVSMSHVRVHSKFKTIN